MLPGLLKLIFSISTSVRLLVTAIISNIITTAYNNDLSELQLSALPNLSDVFIFLIVELLILQEQFI